MANRDRVADNSGLVVQIQNIQKKDVTFYQDPINVALRTGEVVVVVGPNGVGKSALVEEMGRFLRSYSDVEQFSGYRQIYFQSDDVDQVGLSLETLRTQLSLAQVNRMRNPWGEQHLRSVVRRIINRQYQDNNDLVATIRGGNTLSVAENEHILILDELNGIFEAGRLAVRILLENGSLKAKRGINIYGIDRMSDGERAALLLIGAILVRPTSSRIVIDEPERHLNPAIAGPLIAAALRARPDLGYVFATHDLSLLDWMSPAQVIHVSNSEVITHEPEVRRYKIESVRNTKLPSEGLRTAVFGSRRALLLVEGSDSSSDEALFGHLYEDWNIVGRGGWESVATEVRAINNNKDLHWLQVAGIIDGDGRDQHEKEQLAADSIFTLPFPTIENIFFYEPVVKAMIGLRFSVNGGKNVDDSMSDYTRTVLSSVEHAKEDIVNRRLVWQSNRILASNKVSVKSIRDGQDEILGVDLKPLRADITREVEGAISLGITSDIVVKVPIKNTKVPAKLCAIIGFNNFSAYQQAVLHQLQVSSPVGLLIKTALRAILPSLPAL